MLKEDNCVTRQLELVIKRAALQIRKDRDYSAAKLAALARLTSEYRALLEFEENAGEPTEENFYEKIESGESAKIQYPD